MTVLEFLVTEAAHVLGVPIAWIGVLTESGEEILAGTGTKSSYLPMDLSVAARVRDDDDVVAVTDPARDSRFSSHPMVTRAPHIAFIASIPLKDRFGRPIGALSAVATQPHAPLREELAILRLIGRLAGFELSSREEMAEERERFHDFFEQTRDLLLSIASDGTVLHANDTAMQVLGIMRGTMLVEAVEPDRRDDFVRVVEKVFTGKLPQRVETIFTSSDRHRIILDGWLMPKVVAGAAVFARVVFRDVSDRKEFETELANARDAALDAARAKTAFLANVSHEIRTPMNAIVGMIDLLMDSKLDEEQQDFAHQARAAAEQLLSIVSNVLHISNLQAGSVAASRVAFDVQQAMVRIVEVMKIAVLGRDVSVRLSYDPEVPTILRGNQSKVRQAVTNLMENAVRFTEEGEVVLTVSLQTETDTHRVVRFEVRDTGIGIAEEDRLLLFERFSQLENTSTRRYSGAGLGLATARQLVETMGGLIDVDSAPGKGSTFWFTVPFKKEEVGRRPIASSDFELRGKRALLVDRQADSQRLALHYLGNTWEMRTQAVSNRSEALAAIAAAADAGEPFQLIVFEELPDLEPRELARIVRNDPRTAGAGLVQMVPSTVVVVEPTLREQGIDAWTWKPIGQRELFDAIAIAIAREAIPLPRKAPEVERSAASSEPRNGHEAIRILLVEDNFLNMKLTVSQLRKLGYDPDTVTNGSEAIAAVRRRRYDVILMDCQMPVMDGFEATKEIRRLERGGAPRHHIIAMTANALEGDRERCLAAGMDDYLAKPTHQAALERALQTSLRDRDADGVSAIDGARDGS